LGWASSGHATHTGSGRNQMCPQRNLGERTKIAGKTTKLQMEQSKLVSRRQPWAEELTAAQQG
jgi:hypothetical protein